MASLLTGCVTTATARIEPHSLVDAAGTADDQSVLLSTDCGRKDATGATEILLHLDPRNDAAVVVPLRELQRDRNGGLRLPPYDLESQVSYNDLRDARMRTTNVPATAVVVTGVVLLSILAAGFIVLTVALAGKTYPGGD